MKILFVSMPSVHVIRWIENLRDTNYELYWFDVLGRGRLETLESVSQFVDWKKRKVKHIKGEYFISKKFPSLSQRIMPFLEVSANEALETIINEIRPSVIHSFEMQNCSYPILNTMNKFPDIKWIYSCWGTDLYYFKEFSNHNKKIIKILERVNYLHTDCKRDFNIAKQLGFKGTHLGIIPGGAGYLLDELEQYKKNIEERNIILVKGYQHNFGRALNVLKAIKQLYDTKQLSEKYEIVVFGAHNIVIDYIQENKLPFKAFLRHELNHSQLLPLFGKSLLYIGNSISDGMPNTLLEAIVMGAFPIQSNPGGVTSEIIVNGKNGFLINNPNDVNEISKHIQLALQNQSLLKTSYELNTVIAKNQLDHYLVKDKIKEMYNKVFLD